MGTIHGLCNQLIVKHRHRTPLGNSYETLDDLTQLLFLIFEHFNSIACQDTSEKLYFGRWKTKWTAIAGMRDYFNKIT